MSIHFSPDNSLHSLQSDYISSNSSSSLKRSMGSTGSAILNSSYPLAAQRSDLKKENETYAYLEKLKNLNTSVNKIEHIHYLRHLEYNESSFDITHSQKPRQYLPLAIREVKYKQEETKDNIFDVFSRRDPPQQAINCQVRLKNAIEERNGILLPFNFVLTVENINKNTAKHYEILNSSNQKLKFNKFGPYIAYRDFTIIPVDGYISEFADVYTNFKLRKANQVYIIGSDTKIKMEIVEITQTYFVFTAIGYNSFIKGSAVFSTNWELQGIFSHSVLDLHFVLRFEPILSYLISIKQETNHKLLNSLLHPYLNYIQ